MVSLFLFAGLNAQVMEINYVPAEIDFGVEIADWDGFGFNKEAGRMVVMIDAFCGPPNPGGKCV